MPYYESPYRTIKRAVEAGREAELAASLGSALRDLIEGAQKAVRECEHYGQHDYKRIHEYYLRELRTLRDCMKLRHPGLMPQGASHREPTDTMVTNRAPVSPNDKLTDRPE